MASSQGDRALTCKLPSKKNAPFLRFNIPDWSKLDVVGKTILLAELTTRLGSFHNACAALSLQSNEVKNFLETYLQAKEAFDQGELSLNQWLVDEAALAVGENIPQQEPIFINASSIEPACDFLRFLAHDEYVPAIQSWVGRYIVWPPQIDVSHSNIYGLNQPTVNLPQPPQQAQLPFSRYTSSLGNDTRAMVALIGAWRPKADGTPDARIAFIDVPDGTIAHGPSGSRPILGAGRYYVCWPTMTLVDNMYNDFVLARNTTDNQEERNDRANQSGPSGYEGLIVNNPTVSNLGGVANLNIANAPLVSLPHMTINPKEVFGFAMPDAHDIVNKGPFHSAYEPQGPPRALPNPELQKMWTNWNGQVFQFRLPRDYTIMGPLGTILTFDLPQHQTYDEVGNPHGVGGTYYIVPPPKMPSSTPIQMSELPPNVPLRMKTTEPLVLIRNGLVLPRFVAPGVHEWSIHEGHLDFYGAEGCYDLLNVEGRYDVIPGMIFRSFTQQIPRENHHGTLYKGRYKIGCKNGLSATQDAGLGDWQDYGHAGNDTQHNDENANKQGDEQNAENDEVSHERHDIECIVISDDDDEDEVQQPKTQTTKNAPAIEEALQILAPYREWLDQEEAEEIRREKEEEHRAQLEERQKRKEEKQKAGEQAARTVPVRQIMTRGQTQVGMGQIPSTQVDKGQPDSQARASRLRATQQPKQQSEFVDSATAIEPDLAVPVEAYPKRGRAASGRKRKNQDSDDDEYKPARPRASRASRARNTAPIQTKPQATITKASTASGIYTLAPMKQTTLTNFAIGTNASNSAPALNRPQGTLTTTASNVNTSVPQMAQATFNTTTRAFAIDGPVPTKPQVPATVNGNNVFVPKQPTPIAGSINGLAPMEPRVTSTAANVHTAFVFKPLATPTTIMSKTNGPALNNGNNAPAPTKPQGILTVSANGTNAPKSGPAPKKLQGQPAQQPKFVMYQPSATPMARNSRPVVERKPIGPLLDAIRAHSVSEGGTGRQQLHIAPKVDARETPVGPVDSDGAAAVKKTIAQAKPANLTGVKPEDLTRGLE